MVIQLQLEWHQRITAEVVLPKQLLAKSWQEDLMQNIIVAVQALLKKILLESSRPEPSQLDVATDTGPILVEMS